MKERKRKWVWIFGTMLGAVALVAGPAQATTLTMSLADLYDVYVVSANGGSLSNVFDFGADIPEASNTSDGDIDYDAVYNFQTLNATETVWGSASFGFDFWGDGGSSGSPGSNTIGDMGYGDLTGYDTFALTLSNEINQNGENLQFNLWLNTGWTDIGETDEFRQNGWTWIPENGETTLSIDLTGMAHLDHVSSIGFMMGTNFSRNTGAADSAYTLLVGPDLTSGRGGYSATIDFNAEPVPEPASLALLGLGLLGFGIRRSRRRS